MLNHDVLLFALLQGWQERNVPLVREMRRHIDQGHAWEARQAFEETLAPLEAAMQRVSREGCWDWELVPSVLLSTCLLATCRLQGGRLVAF